MAATCALRVSMKMPASKRGVVIVLLFVLPLALQPVAGFAQSLTTPASHEVNAGVGGYNYVEPGSLKISIHGPKFSGEYTGVLPLNARRHWFVKANARTSIG